MTPHEILGIAVDATPEQIKSAYRKLAMQYHPDRNQDSPESIEKFRDIQSAYETLTKPAAQKSGDPFADFSWAFGGNTWNGFRQQPPRNADFQMQADITLEQAYEGCALTFSVNDKAVTIDIPKGIQHGQRLTAKGFGSHDKAELPPGDLHIIIVFRNHAIFTANGPHLVTQKDVSAIDLMLGCTIEIITLAGERLSVDVPAGSSQRTRLRIAAKGMPLNDDFGDIYVLINPVFPTLSDAQVEALQTVRDLTPEG